MDQSETVWERELANWQDLINILTSAYFSG